MHEVIRMNRLLVATLAFPSMLAAQDSSRPRELDSVKVTATRVSGRMREFEERRVAGFGRFLSRAELAKEENRRVAEVLSQIGVRVVRTNGTRAFAGGGRGPSTRGAMAACLSDVYLDGVLVYGSRRGEQPFSVNQLNVMDLGGIEYYSGNSQTPSKFNRSGASCGVLVLWTRDPGT